MDPQWIEAYWDDVNGGWLSLEEVKKARQLEMDYLHKQGVYRCVQQSSLAAMFGRNG